MTRRVTALMFLGLLMLAPRAFAGIINVPAGGDLQAAINQAQPGDTIMLAPGATYTGNFMLPAKGGSSYITIRSGSADANLPAPGQRITPAYSGYLAKLQPPGGSGQGALTTAPYASYYIIELLEFLPNPSGVGALISLGSADSTQNSLSVVPHDLIVDRCYIHSTSSAPQLRGIMLNSTATTISNSYISDIKYNGSDSQAIAGWNTPGALKILNNYLEAAGENILIGGSSMFIPNVTPTNIEIRNNYITKPLSWRGSQWTIKNLLELKHAQDVIIDGNIIENIWAAAQPGYAMVFTPRNQYGDNPWTIVQRVTFSNNLVRHVGGCWNVLGWDNEGSAQQTNHITFRNNVVEDVSSSTWGGSGRLLLISETPYVTMDHNTVFNTDSAVYGYNTASYHFVMTNNIVNAAVYGIVGDSAGTATAAISKYFPDASFADNLFIGNSTSNGYPSGNYYPASYSAVGFVNFANGSGGDYHLASSSPYKTMGTDGKDPGTDIDALNAALAKSTSTGGTPPPPPPPPTDKAPTVSITSPANGASFATGSSVTLVASASDSDSSGVSKVDFYANGALLGTATSSPYSVTVGNAQNGTYSLTAVATDTAGLSTTSSPITVTVATASTPPPDNAPTVSLTSPSTGYTCTTGTKVTLAATATDTDASGVKQVAFYSNGTMVGSVATAPYTITYSPSQAGTYSLTAVATDTAGLSKTSTAVSMTVTATAPPPTTDSAPVVSITSPASGATFATGSSVTIVANATDTDGTGVKQVSFYANGSLLGTVTSSPYTVTVAIAQAGTYSLTAVATDTAGLSRTSAAVSVTVGATGALPTGYADADVGAVGLKGSATFANNVFTVKGAGADVWGSADAFNFVYQTLSGDGQIVARVASFQAASSTAKAGVMMRESLNANAKSVLVNVKYGGGVEVLARTATGGATSYVNGASSTGPVWVKIVRKGTTITVTMSTNGTTWTTLANGTLSMATNLYVGLAVCSHNTAALATATFDNVAR